VVKRINHLEATNVQLREEAEKYRSERTAYKVQVEDEAQSTVAEKEAQLERAETDLARIRNARDELLADQQMRKAAQDQEKTAGIKLQELADAREARITALESEIERLRLQIDSSKAAENVAEMPLEELRSKYTSLERQYSMLNTELTSMQTAYKRFSTLASQKVTDFGALEEKVARLTAEKSKADQKYFAAMKSKEARDVEVRTLRMQNSKTSDIVSQLKESESAARSLLSNMDKQASEAKEALNSALDKHRVTQQQLNESIIQVEGLRNQVSELKALSNSKDATLGSTSSALRQAETEISGLKQTLTDTKKSLENWKGKSLGNNSSEYEMLRVSFWRPGKLSHGSTNPNLDPCPVHGVPPQLEEYGDQNMRSCFLQRMRRRTPHVSLPQVSQLQQIVRRQRPHAHHPLIRPLLKTSLRVL
jgi:E3 ubiquitin-protein ligase BRE1